MSFTKWNQIRLATHAAAWSLLFTHLVAFSFANPADDRQTSQSAQLQQRILGGARAEAARATPYIMEYHVLAYPGGDVPQGTGVCTDLVVRAFRSAGIDLQKLLHEDRVAHPEAYPTHIWDDKRADANIDHRRCQNLDVWFLRHARSLPTATDAAHPMAGVATNRLLAAGTPNGLLYGPRSPLYGKN